MFCKKSFWERGQHGEWLFRVLWEASYFPGKLGYYRIKAHFEHRRKLYRQCGIPTIAFRNAEILEVGPGGG